MSETQLSRFLGEYHFALERNDGADDIDITTGLITSLLDVSNAANLSTYIVRTFAALNNMIVEAVMPCPATLNNLANFVMVRSAWFSQHPLLP